MLAALLNLTAEKSSPSILPDTRRTRPRFFDGKFLTAADLAQEQAYLLARQADLGRTLGFGVVTGLRVSRAERAAGGLPRPAASVTVGRGHGLTPAGEIVFLPHELTVDLTNVPQMQRLSAAFGLTRAPQAPFLSLRGLYVLGLRAVEFTANPTPAYPPGVDGDTALRDGEVIEATALTLVPYESDASRQDAESARSRAAREIFLEQKIAPLPAGVLPLALLYLRHGALEWVDEWLVRREAGDDDRFGFGFAPRALAEAHFFHYQERVREAPAAAPGQLAARTFLELVPPAGPLPADALNPADFTQAFFPAEARVELALVPEDELAALMEDSLDLPPIDLNLRPEDQDALALLVLAPVPRAAYGNVLQTLARTPTPALRNPFGPLLAQQKPIQALLKLNQHFLLRRGETPAPADAPVADFVDPAWREALKSAGPLWYLRRRNLPDGRDLAGTPLAVAHDVVRPGAPADPARPETPSLPVNPPPVVVRPIDAPVTPATPVTPDRPLNPGTPLTPVRPTSPVIVTPVRRAAAPGSAERKLGTALAAEGLWGRFAFLRAISDAPTHAALVELLADPLVAEHALLQHAVFTALEKALPAVSESPEENFEQIQKDAHLKELTGSHVAAVAQALVSEDTVRGLQAVVKAKPRLASGARHRRTLGRTDRIGALAQIGLKHADHAGFGRLLATVERNAGSGRAQAAADAIDRFLRKVNA